MRIEKTTRDWIEIDLDGTIDAAIKKLTKLKKEYPKGKLYLDNYMEYGEHYSRLRIDFTRPKEPIELEYDEWRKKLEQHRALRHAARTFANEGLEYPRQAEMDALTGELGAWAEDDGWGGGSLSITGDELVMHGFRGGQRRDGTWAYKVLGFDDYERVWAKARGIEAAEAGETA